MSCCVIGHGERVTKDWIKLAYPMMPILYSHIQRKKITVSHCGVYVSSYQPKGKQTLGSFWPKCNNGLALFYAMKLKRRFVYMFCCQVTIDHAHLVIALAHTSPGCAHHMLITW